MTRDTGHTRMPLSQFNPEEMIELRYPLSREGTLGLMLANGRAY